MVNGPNAGHVWTDDRASDGPIYPLTDDGGRITSDRWHRKRLTEAEALCAEPT
ncbi:hypothetical protein [Kutzneria sp. NPDC052558]|uniref:hypothetical protein n=1 Tax=Kutzneria sp. NPDC052558 TaxID=3364121 RepID=UPI0037C62250